MVKRMCQCQARLPSAQGSSAGEERAEGKKLWHAVSDRGYANYEHLVSAIVHSSSKGECRILVPDGCDHTITSLVPCTPYYPYPTTA